MGATGYTKGDPQKVARAGDTMTGELILPDSSPDTSLTAASRGYVDNASQTLSADLVSLETDTVNALSASLSTGWAYGGRITISATPKAVDIAAGVGYVMDSTSLVSNPTYIRVSVPAQTVLLDGPAQTRQVTWWLIAANGSVVQQADKPTAVQRRTHLIVGVSFGEGTGIVLITRPHHQSIPQTHSQMADLMEALGTFAVEGGNLVSNGANLTMSQLSGTLFTRSFNQFNLAGQVTNSPHLIPILSQTPAQFRHLLRTENSFGALVTSLDVTHYDLNGVLTLIPGGANVSTIFRVWTFPSEVALEQLSIQYGQNTYPSLNDAVNAVGTSNWIPNVTARQNGAMVTWICVTKSATNLSDPAQAVFISAGRFARP